MSPFIGVTDNPVLDFWWHALWASKLKYTALFALGRSISWLAFPESQLWCATCWPLGGQHGSWSLHHMPVSTAVGCQIRLGELPHSSQMSWMVWGNFCWISLPVMSLPGWNYSLGTFTTTSPCVASTYFRTATLQSKRKKTLRKKVYIFSIAKLQSQRKQFILPENNFHFHFFIVFFFFCKRSISLSMLSHIPADS